MICSSEKRLFPHIHLLQDGTSFRTRALRGAGSVRVHLLSISGEISWFQASRWRASRWRVQFHLDHEFCVQTLIPGPSLELPTNSMPADSSAERTCSKFLLLLGGTSSTCSKRFTVLTPSPAFCASVSLDHLNAARAARICEPVIT